MKHKFFSKRNIIIASIAVVVLLTGWFVFASNGAKKNTYVTDKVVRKDLIQTVSEVGTVESPTQIDLSFSSPGKLAVKLVTIGDKVKSGQILAQLDSKALVIQFNQASSSLIAAKANLNKLVSGVASTEKAVVQAQVAQALANYVAATDTLDKTKKTVAEDTRQAEKTLSDLQDSSVNTPTAREQAVISAQATLDSTKSTYQKSIDYSLENLLNDIGAKLSVANTALDNINKITTDSSLKNYLSSKSPIYLANTNFTYDQGTALLDEANASLVTAKAAKNNFNVTNASDDASVCLKKVAESLDNMYSALENSIITNQSILDTHKANISAQITFVSAAINVVAADRQNFDGATLSYDTNVSTATNNLNQAGAALSDAILAAKNSLSSIKVAGEQKISAANNSADTARQSYDVAQKQLAQLIAPARAEDLSLAQAKVNDAQAALDLIKKQIDDSTIKSPIDGQIIRENYEVGEQISGIQPVYSVLAESSFEINVDISESDIVKVKKDDAVEITLDAFGQDTKFNGTVYFIEPASTVIQDVIYYKVKIKFTDSSEVLAGVKPGMTANITIVTDKKDGVLTIPERAVIEKSNSEKIVRVLLNNKITEVPVKTGLRGDDGLVEILSGDLTEGETIILLINTK